jgi:gas vesicle protein
MMNNNSKIFVALAAGLAAGAVLGVLFAPEKGADTRKKILDQGKKLSDDVKNKFSKGMEKLNDLKDGLKEKVEEFA